MKMLILTIAAVATSSAASAIAQEPAPRTWVDDYDMLLGKYVTPRGVKYKSWHASSADRRALKKVITRISKEKLSGKSRDEQLAFYLNAYNAWILHRILQDYPTDGPGGGGFFGRRKFFGSENITVAGKKTSFSLLENKIIRPRFKEPRTHFALNCASASCPPLNTRAFRGETLDETLDALTRNFINKNRKGVIAKNGGKKLEVSKIFDWYQEDFRGGTVTYLNKYRTKKLPKNAKVSFQKYHWTLNETR